jgi:hypothetical protein
MPRHDAEGGFDGAAGLRIAPSLPVFLCELLSESQSSLSQSALLGEGVSLWAGPSFFAFRRRRALRTSSPETSAWIELYALLAWWGLLVLLC